jgi:hypothetical protein
MTSNQSKHEDVYGGEVFDVPRQSSRCKVVVYSHANQIPNNKSSGIVDCTNDVIQCETSKTIKGGGGASFVLVPRKNYINFIFPNDLVNIYFDPGDGRGYIRTFFGYVDRIDRNITTGNNGESVTRFAVTCSDFTKAFAKAMVYFNPHLAHRGDFVSQFFGHNIGGAALRTKGIAIHGNPADVVVSLAHLVLSFGAQFQLPRCYPAKADFVKANRWRNNSWARNKLPDAIRNAVGTNTLENYKRLIEETVRQIRNRSTDEQLKPYKKVTAKGDKASQDEAARSLARIKIADVTSALTPATIGDVLTSGILEDLEKSVRSKPFTALMTQERITLDLQKRGIDHLFDLIDMRFVESRAIDGSILSSAIWSSSGPVWSIMNSWSNDMVNELFCDLRPVGATESKKEFDLKDGGYSTQGDEVDGNLGGSGQAVKFVPALIMREYPFSTIEGIVPPEPIEIFKEVNLGPIPFSGVATGGAQGGIFTQKPNSSGRRVITIKPLNPFVRVLGLDKGVAAKHLDVAAISVSDIISERIGRSDNDVVNCIEVFSDLGFGPRHQFLHNKIIPIASPISVLRDGLRVRRYTTKYARWPAARYKSTGVDGGMARFQTIRWAMMLDHWYQHNIEYLNGTITTRAFPEIRVGYRLDIAERNESYYVEGTNHNWQYTDKGGLLQSTFTLSRGQRNDPFPVYVTPPLENWGGFTNRDGASRLAIYFRQMDPHAVKGSIIALDGDDLDIHEALQNYTDIPTGKTSWAVNNGENRRFYAANSTAITDDANQKEADRKKEKQAEARLAKWLAGVDDDTIAKLSQEAIDSSGKELVGKIK